MESCHQLVPHKLTGHSTTTGGTVFQRSLKMTNTGLQDDSMGKALAAKSQDPGSIPRSHLVEVKNRTDFQKLSSDFHRSAMEYPKPQ